MLGEHERPVEQGGEAEDDNRIPLEGRWHSPGRNFSPITLQRPHSVSAGISLRVLDQDSDPDQSPKIALAVPSHHAGLPRHK